MAVRIDALTGVPEENFIDLIRDYREVDNADIVTAYRDTKGTFTVESTIFDRTAGGGATGTISVNGKMSVFGGPNDHGVGPNEGLAILDPSDVAGDPALFGPQPVGTTGLARRLNPQANYMACRWNYAVTPKSFLKTIKVKVTNPKNGRSIDARPADWGPNASTGRTADLSPGLATALGLDTDDVCELAIPTPGGSQLPPANAGIATGVNLKAIDASTFPPDMTRKLVVMTTFDNATYWVTNQTSQQDGGQSLLRRVGSSPAEIVLSDSTVFPVQSGDKIPAVVAAELNKAAPKLPATPAAPASPPAVAKPAAVNPPAPGGDTNAKEFASAKAFVNHDTSHVPGTDGGNLACAWSVNEVTRLAFGKPISTDGGHNGLGTAGLFDVLKARHTKLASASNAGPGTIIIAPTVGANHGHVGVVGATTGSSSLVYSNSSSAAKFAQNYTIKSFTDRYVGKGLQVLFFNLKADQFT